MTETNVASSKVDAEKSGVSPWIILDPGHTPLVDKQIEEPITGPVEFRDRVQSGAGSLEIVLSYALSSVILGSITVPIAMHRPPMQHLGPSNAGDYVKERMIVPDLRPPSLPTEPTASEPVVSATGAGATAATASPATATVDQSSNNELPQQPSEPVPSPVPRAPTIDIQ